EDPRARRARRSSALTVLLRASGPRERGPMSAASAHARPTASSLHSAAPHAGAVAAFLARQGLPLLPAIDRRTASHAPGKEIVPRSESASFADSGRRLVLCKGDRRAEPSPRTRKGHPQGGARPVGLMEGFPPEKDAQVTLANWRTAPFNR